MQCLPALLLLLLVQQKVQVPGVEKPVVVYTTNTPNPGLVVGLHMSLSTGAFFAGQVGPGRLTSAGYMAIFPSSLQGSWNTIATGGTPEGRIKDSEQVALAIKYFIKKYNVHPDKVHLIGFSAGSTFACTSVAFRHHLDDVKIRSICAHSGGVTGKSRANPVHAEETTVWIMNGTGDPAHAEPSRNMADSFKEAGYEVIYDEVPGARHLFPVVSMSRILDWWKKLDAGAPDIGRIESSLSRAEKSLEKEKWSSAYRSFLDAQKAAKGARRYQARIETGLGKIESAAKKMLQEAEPLRETDPAGAKKLLKRVTKAFKGTPYAKEAKEILKGLR